MMDLSRGLSVMGGVRSVPVVPIREDRQLTAEIPFPDWHQNHIHALALQASDEPLDNSDASLLPHGAKARPNALLSAPVLETLAPELFAFVADQVFWFGAFFFDCTVQERLHCSGGGGLFEYNSSQDTPGAVIQHDAYPPAEWPLLRK